MPRAHWQMGAPRLLLLRGSGLGLAPDPPLTCARTGNLRVRRWPPDRGTLARELVPSRRLIPRSLGRWPMAMRVSTRP